MKHQKTILYLGALGVLLGLTSCYNGCDEKPALEEFHYGLLDSMPAGIRVVFESNTGKLDTATYGPIIKKVLQVQTSGGGRCDEQVTYMHYEEQDIDFKNKFGLANLKFIRRIDYMSNIQNKYIWYRYYIDNITYNETRPKDYLDSLLIFKDVGHLLIFDSKENVYGNFSISNKNGVIQFQYKISNTDSIFTFKEFLQ